MLLPGFSLSFYAAALNRSRSSIANYRAAAVEAAQFDVTIMEAVESAVCAIKAEHGLQMALYRGKAQLPTWSRLAIGEYSKRGFSRREIAKIFRCSCGTVANVLQGKGITYDLFSGTRNLSPSQMKPSGRWQASKLRNSRRHDLS